MKTTDFDFSNYIKNIEYDLQSTEHTVRRISNLQQYHYGQSPDRAEIEEYENNLAYELRNIHLKIIFGLEYLSLNKLLELYLHEYSKYESKLGAVEYNSEYDFSYNEAASLFTKYKDVINCQSADYQSDESYGISLLKTILTNTDKFLHDLHIIPQSEAQVQKSMHPILSNIFPSTMREITVNQINKNYKADFGIPDLKCAVEYKYVDSETEMKNCFGGLYEDMKGYEGTSEWKKFFAVVYMTSPFITVQQIAANNRRVKLNANWEIIRVVGKGERLKNPGKNYSNKPS